MIEVRCTIVAPGKDHNVGNYPCKPGFEQVSISVSVSCPWDSLSLGVLSLNPELYMPLCPYEGFPGRKRIANRKP